MSRGWAPTGPAEPISIHGAGGSASSEKGARHWGQGGGAGSDAARQEPSLGPEAGWRQLLLSNRTLKAPVRKIGRREAARDWTFGNAESILYPQYHFLILPLCIHKPQISKLISILLTNTGPRYMLWPWDDKNEQNVVSAPRSSQALGKTSHESEQSKLLSATEYTGTPSMTPG